MKSVLGRGISVFGESSCFLFAHELSCHMKLLFCMYELEPNASEIIKPGDEIGIGKLKFIYR